MQKYRTDPKTIERWIRLTQNKQKPLSKKDQEWLMTLPPYLPLGCTEVVQSYWSTPTTSKLAREKFGEVFRVSIIKGDKDVCAIIVSNFLKSWSLYFNYNKEEAEKIVTEIFINGEIKEKFSELSGINVLKKGEFRI